MNASTEKQSLRPAMVARILEMAPDHRDREESELIARFPGLPGFEAAGSVLLYASAFPEEIKTGPLLKLAIDGGKRLILPRVDRRAKGLILHEIRDLEADLRSGMLGIPEPRKTAPTVDPEEVDWALVPGLAFDPRGYRLGRGAGHYDRLLPRLRPGVLRYAICLDCQWIESLPAEPHDVALDGVVSPSRTERRHSDLIETAGSSE